MELGSEELPSGTHSAVDEDGRYRWRATVEPQEFPERSQTAYYPLFFEEHQCPKERRLR